MIREEVQVSLLFSCLSLLFFYICQHLTMAQEFMDILYSFSVTMCDLVTIEVHALFNLQLYNIFPRHFFCHGQSVGVWPREGQERKWYGGSVSIKFVSSIDRFDWWTSWGNLSVIMHNFHLLQTGKQEKIVGKKKNWCKVEWITVEEGNVTKKRSKDKHTMISNQSFDKTLWQVKFSCPCRSYSSHNLLEN